MLMLCVPVTSLSISVERTVLYKAWLAFKTSQLLPSFSETEAAKQATQRKSYSWFHVRMTFLWTKAPLHNGHVSPRLPMAPGLTARPSAPDEIQAECVFFHSLTYKPEMIQLARGKGLHRVHGECALWKKPSMIFKIFCSKINWFHFFMNFLKYPDICYVKGTMLPLKCSQNHLCYVIIGKKKKRHKKSESKERTFGLAGQNSYIP